MAREIPLFETADLETTRVLIRRVGGVPKSLWAEMTDWLLFDLTPGVRYSCRMRDHITKNGPVAAFHITDPDVALAFKMRFG